MVKQRYANKVAQVKGVAEADRILKEFANGIDKFTEKHFREGGKVIVQAASARTPIDTGRLVSNNKVLAVDKKKLIVGNPTPYAKYVHDGTSRQQARPFFAQPIAEFKRKFPELIVKDHTEFYKELVRKNRPK